MFKTSYLQLIILLFFVNTVTFNAQTITKKEMEDEAFNALNDGDYVTAYTKFDALNSKYPREFDYLLNLGICCLKNPERKERALEIFTDMKNFYKNIESDFYLGKAYHANYKFDEAIEMFQSYITERGSSLNKEDKLMVAEAKSILANCKNGKLLVDNKVIADIKNIGAPINSDEEQYVPVIATDESILFFTYRGKYSVGGKLDVKLEPDLKEGNYTEDVYVAYKRPDGVFSEPQGIDAINSKGNNAAIAISPDGQNLFTFFSDANNSGDIQMSKLVGDEFSKPEFLNANINSEYWEGSCSISADGRYLYFASERPGGFGGRDIWVSEKINGEWAPAKNMGEIINTLYDDDAPFIHPDGITLFFSSKGHSSIGGYDIMFSIKQQNQWTEPQSMGLPLNTTEDDRYYVINSKGDRGYFSSDRSASGGKGKNDIYSVEPGILGKKPVIALLKGTVFGNDQPLASKIEVIRTINKDLFTKEELEILSNNEISSDGKLIVGTYASNSSTGKYLTTLTPGAVYKVKVTAENYQPIEEEINLEQLSEYEETTRDFYLVSTSSGGVSTSSVIIATPTVAVVTPTTSKTNTTVAITKTLTPKTTTTQVATTKTITPKIITPKTTTTQIAISIPCSDRVLPDFEPLKGKSLNEITYYNQLLSIAGDYCADKLVFKVQIGAYRKPENFKYAHLRNFGKAEVIDYPDGITRFTQKEFTTIKNAETQRQKAIAKGQKDAWIVAFVDGKRYTLEDLILLDFLGKSIN